MIGVLFLFLSACATQLPHVPDTVPILEQSVEQRKLSFAEVMHDHHYVGWFHNDRTRQSYPAVLQVEPSQDTQDTDDNNWQLHAVLRVFTPDRGMPSSISSFYPNVRLRGDTLSFPKAAQASSASAQKITIVGKGKLAKDDSAKLFAVIYGFGQGALHLQRQEISSYSLPETNKYPQALTKIDLPYTEFPQQAFRQQQGSASETKLLEDSKNILSAGLYDIAYELRPRLGVYYGVLHHEYHDRFQYVRLVLSGSENKKNSLTTANTLFFSLPRKREFIVYRYVNSIDGDKLPTILSGQADSFLKINAWDRDKIEALWYSKRHGRIGHVYLQRNSFPQLPKNAKIISALAGNYSNSSYACDIKVNNKVAKDMSLYPSLVHGVVRDLASRKNHQISFGSYDFYRGNVEISYNGQLMRYTLQQDFTPTIIDTALDVR